MMLSSLRYQWVLLIFFRGILFLCMSSCLKSATVPAFANETDHLALLDFKNRITKDPLQIMSSWNGSTHFCNWLGVTCSPSSKRVMVLNLTAKKLTGSIPPSIGNLTYLTRISLGNNNFYGEIPQEVGRLHHLQLLGLNSNSIGGKVPTNLSYCTQLRVLNATYNNLIGQIPDHLSSLSKLVYLYLGVNNLTGNIPAWIGNFSSLYGLGLSRNNFQGSIPSELGRLPRLGFFQLAENYLSVPQSLASLQSLVRLYFSQNKLGYGKDEDLNFLSFLANCTSLEGLALNNNYFGGVLPSSVANLSTQLQLLTLGGNMIHGDIPIGIGNLVNLEVLVLEDNYLGGTLPHVIGKLQNLTELYLGYNKIFGPIPSSLGNLKKLTELYMEGNRFEGRIPPSLGNCQNLLLLDLSHNNLSGTIPKKVMGLSSLSIFLDLSYNFLTGALPFEVGNLIHLVKLDLSKNRLSGKIPTTLETCVGLEHLYLDNNSFEGAIPRSLKNLRGLEDIDLSCNKLSGNIPKYLSKLVSLKHLNLSYNDFEGEVPSEGIFANASTISVFGNDKLCGGVPELHLSSCSSKHPKFYGKLLALGIIIPVTCIIIFVLLLMYFFPTCSIMKNLREGALSKSSFEDWQFPISYAELLESTNGFSENNLIGSGSFGSVYKGVLSRNGAIVAIKVLNLQQQEASTSFINECNALRSIRHRNLLKIFSACSSIDHKGNDFKSLIFEFMCNGSLDQWLHPKNDERHQRNKLSFIQRLNIAIDVAYALEYLHQHCQTPIVHCDIKPSNILLDEDMVAHVGDFGLVRFLFEASNNPSKTQTLSVGLKGSIGYIPPEYGMGGQISTLGDIFSYGILLLEMFTRKKPIDEMFIDGLSIHRFTSMALPEHVMDIVDPSMFFEEDGEDVGDERNEDDIEDRAIIEEVPHLNVSSRIKDCLISVFEIGLSCSTTSYDERMPTNVVVNEMNAIRDTYLKFKKGNRRRMN
ncbi:probable LRR receptor-like serine/threonine-protein kinase At3g47570 isoform X3 [Quercus lobata]|uniref:probable LRR receptor-like serine/threonine-protein kinase At3g47570 isoform X3 n=1 Tax=Quercus lobata TaxID=97700 RepID=UPI0012469208|nr:probable LRR receptor-like serine/threonine-protein kinase At3g47570 isoform X3 [Quercus lobata]